MNSTEFRIRCLLYSEQAREEQGRVLALMDYADSSAVLETLAELEQHYNAIAEKYRQLSQYGEQRIDVLSQLEASVSSRKQAEAEEALKRILTITDVGLKRWTPGNGEPS